MQTIETTNPNAQRNAQRKEATKGVILYPMSEAAAYKHFKVNGLKMLRGVDLANHYPAVFHNEETTINLNEYFIKPLKGLGWWPVQVMLKGTGNKKTGEFVVRLCNVNMISNTDVLPQLVVAYSHDGRKNFDLLLGAWFKGLDTFLSWSTARTTPSPTLMHSKQRSNADEVFGRALRAVKSLSGESFNILKQLADKELSTQEQIEYAKEVFKLRGKIVSKGLESTKENALAMFVHQPEVFKNTALGCALSASFVLCKGWENSGQFESMQLNNKSEELLNALYKEGMPPIVYDLIKARINHQHNTGTFYRTFKPTSRPALDVELQAAIFAAATDMLN